MEITVREYCRIETAAELIFHLLDEKTISRGGIESALGMILNEMKYIRMREAENMNTWGEGELTEGFDETELKALKLARLAKAGKPAGERLPDVPDWRDGAARQVKDDLLTRIRLTVAAHEGESLRMIIDAIKADGTSQKRLAEILGVNPGRITEARQGKPTRLFLAKFCEVLGMEGGAR